MSVSVLGPWGGKGGDAFDDGWSNGGVSKITLYYSSTLLSGLEVEYGNGTTKLHGKAIGTGMPISFGSSGVSFADVAVGVGAHPFFSGDPANVGVVALGLAPSDTPTLLPTGANAINVIRPQVLGFFGGAGDRLDRLGLYLSNPLV